MEGKIVEDKKKVLFHLFISTLYLSAFTFGGGYVIVSLLKKKFVDEYHWIENDEMLDRRYCSLRMIGRLVDYGLQQ